MALATTAGRTGASTTSPGRREVAFTVAALVGYLGAAVWAREVSIPGPVLVWFPPAGVAIGVLYLRPRLLPMLVAAEIFSTAWIMGLADEYGPVWLVVNALVIVGAYHLAGEALRRLDFDPRMRSSDDLVILAFGCLVVGSTLAALTGVIVQSQVGLLDGERPLRSIGLFWVGDVIGSACLTPSIVMIGSAFLRHQPLPIADDPSSVNRFVMIGELVAPSVAAVWLMAAGDTPMQFTYLAFVPVVALATRHGVAAAALSTAALGAVLTGGAHVLIDDPVQRSDIQLLMAVLTFTGIMVGAVVSARRDVLYTKQQLSDVIEATPDLVATVLRDGTVRYLNPCGRALIGIGPDDDLPGAAFDHLPDELAADLMREGMKYAERHGSWSGENRLLRSDGKAIPVSQVLISHTSKADQPVTFSTVCRDMTDQRVLEDQLRQAALYDDATGLPNRALLQHQLLRLVQPSERPTRTAVMLTDIDHLQRVNETFGFSVGDAVVLTVARRLSGLIRGADVLARYGGAQFAIVLPEVTDEFDAILLANRMLDSFITPFEADGHRVRVTGSIGVALLRSGDDPDEGLRRAEIALHRAREAGGGRFALFDQSLEAYATKRLKLESDLRQVLDTRSWWLAFQPVVSVETGEIVAAEALLRWTDPERGEVAPYELIRLAEHTGAIVELGREIVERACTEAAAWQALGHTLSIAVNVSALQLRDPRFVDDVAAVLERTGVEPGRVVFELTETVLADGHGEVTALQALRTLGCQIALDDFGTGFSSLGGLRDLPIDVVKLDRSFITPLPGDRKGAAIVDAIVRLADSFGLVVVAEGVETEAQVAELRSIGCSRMQGFLFSRPVPSDRLSELLVDPAPLFDPDSVPTAGSGR